MLLDGRWNYHQQRRHFSQWPQHGRAKEKMIEWLEKHAKGERTVNYKLRDWLFSRQRYWGEPFPILHFADGTKRALDIDELPLMSA